ncbi:16S rRNA (guanine(966)-N(2))-methyltransferase RsmD [Urechidicola croceus]|uniref:16S rRNA (Guanine(966)-N(2))-methyltransferase RsmD n=1 Tax=Urechidicola croceus TaxID=1850246 RepID=A0A1D8P4N9_9FLAO|nr:16S rRNA (guanine(966)-N(2))-methyltransferase RsmD [Urechidicola croceus]AOW19559.1 16S rRNA (guanine(966)-N(2))-methyltransferase RsmD [Urechidicola croceus]
MRIISGKHKGKKLIAPKNLPVRPTTDMAKEALFNILNNLYYFDEISVLDLFSGTGNISFEFASRGTENITAVDAHFACVKFIHQTSNQLEFTIDTIKSDVFKFLDKTPIKFTVIFADPPYDFEKEKFEKIVDLVFKNNLLEDGGVLIVEHSKHTDLSQHKHLSYSKKYGGNMFSFFELAESK